MTLNDFADNSRSVTASNKIHAYSSIFEFVFLIEVHWIYKVADFWSLLSNIRIYEWTDYDLYLLRRWGPALMHNGIVAVALSWSSVTPWHIQTMNVTENISLFLVASLTLNKYSDSLTAVHCVRRHQSAKVRHVAQYKWRKTSVARNCQQDNAHLWTILLTTSTLSDERRKDRII